ncbi:MAG: photosystem II S4 domain protein [Clostridiales bacterium]|nr:photosystem II S4 domain protein [Clostridiales bacterium]MCF8021335.1 photosystem II S4 domain protein [Clostridiales bacterium]
MLNREKSLNKAKDINDKELIARGLDLAERAFKYCCVQVSDFYNTLHIAHINSALKSIPGLSLTYDGGYIDAERQRLVISPDYIDSRQEDSELSFLSLEGNVKLGRMNHRDFLGAVLGLGVRREKVGDILLLDASAQVVVAREVVEFICLNLFRVGSTGVAVREISRNDLSPLPPNIKKIRSTVPSLRLDVVAAAAFVESRGKISKEISAQKVTLNWNICTRQSAAVSPGDMISIKGKGRAEIDEVLGNTKKGRIAIIINRYI